MTPGREPRYSIYWRQSHVAYTLGYEQMTVRVTTLFSQGTIDVVCFGWRDRGYSRQVEQALQNWYDLNSV